MSLPVSETVQTLIRKFFILLIKVQERHGISLMMCNVFQKPDGLRLLVVDDDPDARELLTVLFSGDGVATIAVASASEALETLSRFQPDILISDIALPDEDGYSLVLKVRNIDASRGRKIPAIALSAYTWEEDSTRALSAGFDRYLSKPFDLDELVSVVNYLHLPYGRV